MMIYRNKLYLLIIYITFLSFTTACTEETSALIEKDIPIRVVVLSPAIAEMMEELGLSDCIVGIGEFGPWPESLQHLPVVGGYSNPNTEQIITMDVDAVMNTESQAAAAAHRRLEILGIEIMSLDTSTINSVFETISHIGNRFKRQREAIALIASIRNDINAIRSLSKDLKMKRVLFVVGRDPLFVAGPGSHIDFMIELAGGRNIVHDAIAPYQQISMETILERNPEVIIDSSLNNDNALRGQQIGSWGEWSFLSAVKNNQIYWVDPSQLVIPGIRMAGMTRLMGKFIHPEIFGNPGKEDYLKYDNETAPF